MILSLDIEPRDIKEENAALRTRGSVPAVLYGRKEASTPIAVDERNFERAYRDAGQTSVVTLHGVGEDKETLIHDVQLHPVTGKPLHVDFYVLEKGKKVTLNIPLEFEGLAPAEKLGGVLVKALHEIEIEVAPAELPKQLVVDLTKLENIGDHITAAQIALPASAELITDPEEIVASVTEAQEEEPEPAPAEAAAATEAAPAAEGGEKKE